MLQFISVPPNNSGFKYHVYSGGPFSGIQAAIDSAVAAGANGTNEATIFVYPKANTSNGSTGQGWIENLTVYPGIHLCGAVWAGQAPHIFINGSITFAPTTGLTFETGFFSCYNLYVKATANTPTFTYTGTNTGRVYIKDCKFEHGSSFTNPTFSCSGANTDLTIEGTEVNHSSNSAFCFDQNGGTILCQSNVNTYLGKTLNLQAGTFIFANGTLQGRNNSGATIEVANGATFSAGNASIINTSSTSGSHGINVASGGICQVVNNYYSVATGTGFVIQGVAGSAILYAHPTFASGKNVKFPAAAGAGLVALTTTPTVV